ncbi:MAG: glycosyltransferase family 2 protein [Candidatus Sumerlaeia bacterium]|nr:glycosyltransferase family 2 protein [Candidatus Sumerlaeia bacterium]
MMPASDPTSRPAPKFSIVVLTFNSESFIVPCLESIAAVQYPDLEVIVVDNASSDKTVERARATGLYHILIPNTANRGCAGGYNDGWRASGGEIILFLNPDTTVDGNIAGALAEAFAAHPDAAVFGCKILYPDARRTFWHAGGIVHPNGMTGHRGKDEPDTGQYDSVCEIDYASGCAIAVRRDVLERFGGFNEDYWPGYFEEVDFCWRARRAGYRILYVPRAVVYHHESQSFKLHSPSFFHYYYRNRMRFVAYNYTFRQMLTRFLPFEYRWWRQVPEARGYRLRQVRYYFEGVYFYGRRRFRRKE